MSADTDISRAFATADGYARVETFAASSLEVDAGARRLEGAFYGSAGYRALQAMKRAGFRTSTVGQLAQVIWLGPFGRVCVDEPDAGVPFLSSSEMLAAKPEAHAYLSRALSRDLNRVLVREGTILVSRSGTIGNIAICTADFDRLAVSEHAIRVVPNDGAERGVLYAFLQSDVGQFLLTRSKSGSVVESLYEADVSALPIPLLPKAFRREMTQLLDESCRLRVKANHLLGEAQTDVQRGCYLPDLKDLQLRNVLASEGEALVFTDRAGDRLSLDRGFGEVRVDATYHYPVALALAARILAKPTGTTLGAVIRGVRNSTLRKRIYVDDPDLGVPLLGGKQMIQWRPQGLNYLSKALTRNLENETLEDGWTLVSCGGTLGRCMFVHRNFDGYAASQHVMRIIPNPNLAAPGFIYAFLASPYGQVQIEQRSYGSVIPEIRDFQFNSIAIRVPRDKGEAVHEKVVEAFDARADARELEDQVIGLFATAIERGRRYVESEWGTEY